MRPGRRHTTTAQHRPAGRLAPQPRRRLTPDFNDLNREIVRQPGGSGKGRVGQVGKREVESIKVFVDIGGDLSGGLNLIDRPERRRGRGDFLRSGQQFTHGGDDDLRIERLGQHPIAADRRGPGVVHAVKGARQQHHGNVGQARRVAQMPRDIVTIAAGDTDVGENDIGRRFVDRGDRLVAVIDRDHVHVFVGEGEPDDALDGDAVVDQQQLIRHLLDLSVRSRRRIAQPHL